MCHPPLRRTWVAPMVIAGVLGLLRRRHCASVARVLHLHRRCLRLRPLHTPQILPATRLVPCASPHHITSCIVESTEVLPECQG